MLRHPGRRRAAGLVVPPAAERRGQRDPLQRRSARPDRRRRLRSASSGAEILAIYHSHPRWEAVPSRTDLRENHYGPVPRIIVSLLDETPDVRVWRLDPDSYQELPWRIVEPSSRGVATASTGLTVAQIARAWNRLRARDCRSSINSGERL